MDATRQGGHQAEELTSLLTFVYQSCAQSRQHPRRGAASPARPETFFSSDPRREARVSRAVPTVIAQVLSQIRQVGRGSNMLCVGAFALTLVNFTALGGQQPEQQPAAPVSPPALLAAPAPPAVADVARPDPPKPAAEAPKET